MAPISPILVVYEPSSVTFSVFILQTYYITPKLPKIQKHNNTQKICLRQGFLSLARCEREQDKWKHTNESHFFLIGIN